MHSSLYDRPPISAKLYCSLSWIISIKLIGSTSSLPIGITQFNCQYTQRRQALLTSFQKMLWIQNKESLALDITCWGAGALARQSPGTLVETTMVNQQCMRAGDVGRRARRVTFWREGEVGGSRLSFIDASLPLQSIDRQECEWGEVMNAEVEVVSGVQNGALH